MKNLPRPCRTAVALLCLSLGTAAWSQSASPTLTRIGERGQINIGHRESATPFSYFDEGKQVSGFSVELCGRVVDEVKKALGKEVKVNYVPITTANRIAQVTSGGIDMECGTTTITLGRLEQVDFSMPFWITGTQLAVKKGSGIHEAEDLRGKTVAVLQGSSNERALQALSQAKGLNLRFNYVKDYAEGFLSLETGRVDALAGDGTPIAVFAATKARNPAGLEIVGRLLSTDPYGVMFQRGDAEFRVLVNRALARAFASGEAQRLFDKYFAPVGLAFGGDMAVLYRVQSLPE